MVNRMVNNRMVNIFLQTWLYIASYLLINRFLVKKKIIWHLPLLDIARFQSKSRRASKKEKAMQPKRRKTSRLNLLHLLFFLSEKMIIWLCFIEISLNELAVFLNLFLSFKLLTKKPFSLYILWSWNLL